MTVPVLDHREWLYTALLRREDGELYPTFLIDGSRYPTSEAAHAAYLEAFDALEERGIDGEFEGEQLRPRQTIPALPSWEEYRDSHLGRPRPVTPSSVVQVLKATLGGGLDQQRLEALRGGLGLSRRGRLDDEWDELFGSRQLLREGSLAVDLDLYRSSSLKWSLAVSSAGGHPSVEQTARWKAEIVEAAAGAGVGLAEIWVNPLFATA